MDGSRALRFAASILLASTILGAVVAPRALSVAAMQDERPVGLRLETRVVGTGRDGLTVRAGPGQSYTSLTVLPEGTLVHVLSGPRVDENGREWYLVTGYGRGGESGWTSGQYLYLAAEARRADVSAQSLAPGQRTIIATVTAYTWQVPGNGAHGTITRSGTVARWGTVAVDPTVIPLGTRVQIEGYDTIFTAEDTGGAVVGNRLEIFFPDEESAIRFGVQTLRVTVLDPIGPLPPASRRP
jgi:3D (Asp-Asp-Asp) domain-containing protein